MTVYSSVLSGQKNLFVQGDNKNFNRKGARSRTKEESSSSSLFAFFLLAAPLLASEFAVYTL
jgi:hypothetical protein